MVQVHYIFRSIFVKMYIGQKDVGQKWLFDITDGLNKITSQV